MKPRVFLPAIASGVLLWAAFFPLNLGPVAFVALVPWLTLVRAPVSNKRRYFAAYLGGFAFFALATNWVRVAHPMMHLSWLGLAVVMPLFWLASLAIIRQLDKLKVPLAVAVPVALVALEYFRMHFPTGFPFMKHVGAYQMIGFGWYYLGYTQHEFAQLIQIADIGGVYAVSFAVASVNGAVADIAIRTGVMKRMLCVQEEPAASSPPSFLGKGVGGLGFLTAVALLVASIGYGFSRLQHEPFADGPLVSAIQGNVPQGEKMAHGDGLMEQYKRAFGFAYKESPDLIVWPETCYWEDWYEVTPGTSRESVPANYKPALAEADKQFRVTWNVPILFGLSGHEWDGSQMWKYNSALLVGPQSRDHDPIRYDKIHLVPFGEYVPLGDELPFMKWFTPYKYDYSCRPGQQWTRFPLKAKNGSDYTFGCLICYEDSDTYIARQYVVSEPVNFFVNISNDGWFDGTEEHEEHLAICRFRAIETRRSVVRAVNMGISAVIDPDGRVIALPRQIAEEEDSAGHKRHRLNEQPQRTWGESKKIEGVAIATVPIDARESYYAALGDWVPAACWLAVFVGVVAGFIRRKPVAA